MHQRHSTLRLTGHVDRRSGDDCVARPGKPRPESIGRRGAALNEPPEPIAGLTRDHRRFEAAIAEARAAPVGAAAPEPLAALRALLDYELTRHIAKEEQVLFPALQAALDGEPPSA